MNITVVDLKSRLGDIQPISIIDVREEIEFHTFNIGGVNVPLGKLLTEISDLEYNKNKELVVICQHGIRSKTACKVLLTQGFTNVKNLSGGLLAWRKAETGL